MAGEFDLVGFAVGVAEGGRTGFTAVVTGVLFLLAVFLAPVAGIVHRYPDRVLFKLVHVCAVYCRFCFRREMVGPGEDQMLAAPALAPAQSWPSQPVKVIVPFSPGSATNFASPEKICSSALTTST